MACEDLSLTFVRALGAICWTSGLLAIAENLTVILAVRYIRSLRPTARFFMASLAAAELLSGITANMYFVRNYGRSENTFVKRETTVWFFTTTSVTYSLSNVAVDRFVAITSPLHYHDRMTLKMLTNDSIFMVSCFHGCVHSSLYSFQTRSKNLDVWRYHFCVDTILHNSFLLFQNIQSNKKYISCA